MHVHVSVGERFPWRNVEVADDLVHADAALETASFPALLVEVFGVVLALALFDALAAAKGPGDGGVGFADLLARVTAALLDSVVGGRCAVTFAAVRGVEMRGFVFVAASGVSSLLYEWRGAWGRAATCERRTVPMLSSR
jgi:hypothetical protein